MKHVTVLRAEWEKEPKKVQKLVESKLKYPVFVKPANLGSSVGICKAHDRKELGPAMEEAAKFDRKIVIEEGVGGKQHKAREIECSVLGNDEPVASVPGEIVPGQGILRLQRQVSRRRLAADHSRQAHQGGNQGGPGAGDRRLPSGGLLRAGARRFSDGPGTESGKIYLNEINTMPGFTAISMYPKLWAASGLTYPDLIDRLIQLGLERHEDKKKNQYSR